MARRAEQQEREKRSTWSPSALSVFTKSRFAAWMDRLKQEAPEDPRCQECEVDELMQLLATRGELVEKAFLSFIREKHPEAKIVDLTESAGKAARGGRQEKARCVEETKAALREADVVFQAGLFHGSFFGIADFLLRRGPLTGEEGAFEGVSAGDFAVWDTKLARNEMPQMHLQLTCYADALQRILGGECRCIGLVLGFEAAKTGLVTPVEPVFAELEESWADFMAFQRDFDKDGEMPDPAAVAFGNQGRWEKLAKRLAYEADDVRVLVNMTTAARDKLVLAGLSTCEQLAAATKEDLKGVRIGAATLQRFVHKAKLQRRSVAEGGSIVMEFQTNAVERLLALPAPDEGDLFLDLEGDPVAGEGKGLLYLVGLVTRDGAFSDWWAHDAAAEREMLKELSSFIAEKREASPELRIYHYGHYDRSYLKRLVEEAGEEEEGLQGLRSALEENAFEDLLGSVRDSLELSAGGFGLKQLEKIYNEEDKRKEAAVATAVNSVVAYEHWVEAPDGESWRESEQLRALRDYNREDCLSLLKLEGWLRGECLMRALEGKVEKETLPLARERVSQGIAIARRPISRSAEEVATM